MIIKRTAKISILSLLLVALGVTIIGVGFLLYYLPAWSELQGRYIYPYDYDAWRFWAFGFTWIAVVIGDFIYISTKKYIDQKVSKE